ncbi:putative glycosyl transferase [Acetobacter tropicalis NBRC 101654]|uniref:Putative glycosyl transferase n=1 Tax=Acetobacter tropicalis NBRC 101654 TaxID=749388 RepID=F7VC90_9PROT|nr:glycosyltransferase [Acetobacter tropicalis]GAA07985.1 putative glycosyl transferase [Acetobacter tropicalis NBRC 101654]
MSAPVSAPLRVFVQLSYGYGASDWNTRWKKGEIPGINEPYAYGYYRAAGPDAVIVHSEDNPENLFSRLVRYAARLIIGFDFVHAWYNRKGILSADVVWTHTEGQAMAVLLLYRLNPRKHHPPLIAQSIWLMDRWPNQPVWRRIISRSLLSRADLLTFHSPENMKKAEAIFPNSRLECVKFGIRADEIKPYNPLPYNPGDAIRILSLGNDQDRDWKTLIKATSQFPQDMPCHVTIATTNRLKRADHVTQVKASNNDQLLSLYDQAHIVVVPLTSNLHASGITVILEATLRGLPVIATDTGGLRHYFDSQCVCYVPTKDTTALREAILALMRNPEKREEMVKKAQARILSDVNSQHYADRHLSLSQEITSEQCPIPATLFNENKKTPQDQKIVVGIATSGRPALLEETVLELFKQSHLPHQVIVCAPTAADSEGLVPDSRLHILHGPRGASHQRNAILDSVKDADIILFFDDDFLPDRNYLRECAIVFANHSDIAIATGRVLADGAKGPGLSLEEARAIIANAPISSTQKLPPVEPAWNGYGCNMACRFSIIRETGLRFDERLPLYAWYEDIDFSRRAGRLGRIVRINTAVGVHLGSKTGRTPGKKLGYSQVANPLYLAHKGTYPLDHALRSIARNMTMNIIRSIRPEPYIDRRGRVIGNWLALRDVLGGKISPEKILTL